MSRSSRPRRSARLVRPLPPGGDGLAVVKITETDEAGWESPSWYAVRTVPGAPWPHTYAMARLGSRRVYCVQVAATPGASTCECVGSDGDGSAVCRHVGALFALVRTGQLQNSG